MVAMFDTTRNQRLCGAVYLLRLLIETVADLRRPKLRDLREVEAASCQISKPPFIVPFHPKHHPYE